MFDKAEAGSRKYTVPRYICAKLNKRLMLSEFYKAAVAPTLFSYFFR